MEQPKFHVVYSHAFKCWDIIDELGRMVANREDEQEANALCDELNLKVQEKKLDTTEALRKIRTIASTFPSGYGSVVDNAFTSIIDICDEVLEECESTEKT